MRRFHSVTNHQTIKVLGDVSDQTIKRANKQMSERAKSLFAPRSDGASNHDFRSHFVFFSISGGTKKVLITADDIIGLKVIYDSCVSRNFLCNMNF